MRGAWQKRDLSRMKKKGKSCSSIAGFFPLSENTKRESRISFFSADLLCSIDRGSSGIACRDAGGFFAVRMYGPMSSAASILQIGDDRTCRLCPAEITRYFPAAESGKTIAREENGDPFHSTFLKREMLKDPFSAGKTGEKMKKRTRAGKGPFKVSPSCVRSVEGGFLYKV